MKAFVFAVALVVGAAILMAATRPTEYVMLLKLNGNPVVLGTINAGADGGIIDAGPGQVVKIQCVDAGVCLGTGMRTTCAAGTATGELVPPGEVRFLVLGDQTAADGLVSIHPADDVKATCHAWLMR